MAKITNEEEALAAVREDGKALKHMPKNLRTMKVYRAAVKSNGYALKYVLCEMPAKFIKNKEKLDNNFMI